MDKDSKVYIAGHRGLVGSALVRRLEGEGFSHILTRTSKELDLRRQADVQDFFQRERPDYVFLAAARVGGIHANAAYPAEFIYDNLMMESNIVHAAHACGVKKLLFLGSSCIYPKMAQQPIREEALLTSPLEPTNEWYAIAKIAGIKLCQAYRKQYGFNAIAAMPTNLYGPGDNFHPENAHVIPALMRRFHESLRAGKTHITIWGTGTPRREFLHVDDLADALVFLMRHYEEAEHINVGCGEDMSIAELALLLAKTTGFSGEIRYDATRPDGTPRKLLDVTRLTALGWKARMPLPQGLAHTYAWYTAQNL